MPTTTNFGWTTPADTDLVKDGAAAIRTFAGNVDTSLVDLKGGTSGQYLTKNSNTDLDYAWVTLPTGGMTLLSTTTLTGASVTLSSIPATYINLQLVIRNFKPASDDQALQIRINADGAASRHGITTAYGGAQNVTFGLTQADISLGNDNSVANGLTIVDIYDYANTVTWKYWQSQSITVNYATTTNADVYRNHGRYNQIGAISSLLLQPASGNFTSGTALLYGVK